MNQFSIVIIDYGVGNTHSVWNAIQTLGYRRIKISNKEQDISCADVLILPGVGAFGACANNLRNLNLDHILNEAVLVKDKPILGICVGMQLMADLSEENGMHAGLGWIPGKVIKLELPAPFVVPHVGWNDLCVTKPCSLFSRTDPNPHFYFDHSYHYDCLTQYKVANCQYGKEVTAAVNHNNIFGVQFHPEKSQTNGLKLFRGFFNSIS